ncbi:MAG: AsmA family protein [Pseudomonadota bacterium]|nr:AsmA family protein [Pseudomonadota bacterium]
MKTLKIAAIGIGVVLVTALLALVLGVPAGLVVGALQNRVEADTGYRLRIVGNSTVAFWPSLTLTVRDITLFDANDADSLGKLTAESMRFSITFSSLFAVYPQISEIAIARPVLRVPLVRQRSNPTGNASLRPGSDPSVSAKNFPVDRVTIEDGTVVLSSARDHFESRINGIALTASLSGRDGPPGIRALGQWGDRTLRFQVKADGSADTWTGQAVPVQWSFEAPGLLQDPLSGAADIKVAGSTLTINGLKGTIGQSPFTGWASVEFASKPVVKVDLDFQRPTLGLGPAKASDAGGTGFGFGSTGPRSDSNQPWSDREVNIDALNYFDADVQISAAEFRVDKFRFAPMSVQGTVANGVLKAEFPHIGLYGGQGDGVLLVDTSEAMPNQAMRINLRGLRALPLLIDVAHFDALDGHLQAKIDVHATGASLRTVMSTLGGSADIIVQDGEIRDINVAKMIRALAANPLTGWQENKAEKTDLSQLSALFRISNGRATTDNLQLMGPLVRVNGAGSVNIAAKTLWFKLDPKLIMSLEGQGGPADPVGLWMPVVVQGTWGEPRIYPDIAGILDDPNAAYAKLHALGKGLFGSSNAQSGAGVDTLTQGLGNLFGPSTHDRKDVGPNSTGGAKGSDSRDTQVPNLDFLRDLFGH